MRVLLNVIKNEKSGPRRNLDIPEGAGEQKRGETLSGKTSVIKREKLLILNLVAMLQN